MTSLKGRRICDLTTEEVVVGLRIRSLTDPLKLGTIVKIDVEDDHYAWIKWDHESKPFGGFYGNACKCEIVQKEP
jgi:hypothetical protein